MKILIVTMVFFAALFMACSKTTTVANVTVDCSGAAKSYTTDVSPVIQSYCAVAGCHASGSSNGPGALTTYQQIFNASSSIRSAVANGTMPQNSSLSAAQKNAILCWIDNGAANN